MHATLHVDKAMEAPTKVAFFFFLSSMQYRKSLIAMHMLMETKMVLLVVVSNGVQGIRNRAQSGCFWYEEEIEYNAGFSP